ncbi:hypothetical protein [Undibacterium danionis]|uniref:DUF2975 domain-containing protein n=1 Tax=Undibacterium danionis TaxID=1812100 RepID=A0ABV6II39_9BURK
MSIERNKRIAKFKKVSGYLIWVAMPALIISGLIALLLFIMFAFKPIGETGIAEIAIAATNNTNDQLSWLMAQRLNWTAKIFVVVTYLGCCYLILKTLFHFEQLIECFYDGDIFNQKALGHARRAFNFNLVFNIVFIFLHFVFVVISISNIHHNTWIKIAALLDNLLIVAISIGFYSLILWALEIGTDLNEEAELTI